MYQFILIIAINFLCLSIFLNKSIHASPIKSESNIEESNGIFNLLETIMFNLIFIAFLCFEQIYALQSHRIDS